MDGENEPRNETKNSDQKLIAVFLIAVSIIGLDESFRFVYFSPMRSTLLTANPKHTEF
jgi:hypothetical protein